MSLTTARARYPLRRVLAGTDGSARAEEAVRQAARLAALAEGELEVVHAFDPGVASALFRLGPGHPEERGADLLAEAARIAGKEGVVARTRGVVGHPTSALMQAARERWADLLCVGPDAGFLEKPHLLGGVAVHVLHRAPCPVLVARPAPEAEGGGFPRSIVCGVDGSPGSLQALRLAATIAAMAGAVLDLVRVLPRAEPRVPRVRPAPAGPPDVLQQAGGLSWAVGVEPTFLAATGEPEEVLLETAAGHRADLLVVGSRGLHGVSRVLLGSVSEAVSRRAPCSVLVVRAHHGLSGLRAT